MKVHTWTPSPLESGRRLRNLSVRTISKPCACHKHTITACFGIGSLTKTVARSHSLYHGMLSIYRKPHPTTLVLGPGVYQASQTAWWVLLASGACQLKFGIGLGLDRSSFIEVQEQRA